MGAGTSSGIPRVAAPSTGGSLTKPQIQKVIAQAKFTDEGGGQWTLDINGVGGAQILDETGGSRDPYYGMGGKVYGITVWDKNLTIHSGQVIIQGNIGQAKTEAKKMLKSLNNA